MFLRRQLGADYHLHVVRSVPAPADGSPGEEGNGEAPDAPPAAPEETEVGRAAGTPAEDGVTVDR